MSTLSKSKTYALRHHLETTDKITQSELIKILNENLPGRLPSQKVTLNKKKLHEYFPAYYTSEEIEDVIVSVWKIKLTSKACINCELCHNACPVDAIRSPYGNKVKESRQQGVKRLIAYFIILPVIIAAFAVLFNYLSEDFSKVNKEVKLYDMIQQQENNPQDVLPLELETFYGQGYSTDELALKYEKIQQEFKLYSTISGALAGLIIGLILINLSLKRTRKEYEIDHASCVMCCRCFKYCPQNINGIKLDNRS